MRSTTRAFPILVLFVVLAIADPCAANPLPVGACCFPDEACEIIDPVNCLGAGGIYLEDFFLCDPNPCAGEEGACCLSTGDCLTLPEQTCLSQGGTFMGAVYACGACLPCEAQMIACCPWMEICLITSFYACCAAPAYMDGSDSCSPNPCRLGSCCTPSGGCYPSYAGQCQPPDTWHPGVPDCNPNPCSPVPAKETTWGEIKAGHKL